MGKFPKDAPRARVIRAFQSLGFRSIREQNHIQMIRMNADGTVTPLTLPNHARIKGSTLRAVCTQVKISRDDFLKAYDEA